MAYVVINYIDSRLQTTRSGINYRSNDGFNHSKSLKSKTVKFKSIYLSFNKQMTVQY